MSQEQPRRQEAPAPEGSRGKRVPPIRGLFLLKPGHWWICALLVIIAVQSFWLAQRWFPADAWASFFSRFATSPAIAGFFALAAALLGAKSLANQLKHSKEKAAYDAWWQQFEWVTERTISTVSDSNSQKKSDGAQLPPSLAFDLMNSLQRSAVAEFQKDAVDGVLKHYLKEFLEPSEDRADQEQFPESKDTVMDDAGAKSLRNLLSNYPDTSALNQYANSLLEWFDYEKSIETFIEKNFSNINIVSHGGSSAKAYSVEYDGEYYMISIGKYPGNANELNLLDVMRKTFDLEQKLTGAIVITKKIDVRMERRLLWSGYRPVVWNENMNEKELYYSILEAFREIKSEN